MSARDWRKRKTLRVGLPDDVSALLADAAEQHGTTPSQTAEHLLSEMAFLLRHDDWLVPPPDAYTRREVMQRVAEQVLPMMLACACGDLQRVRNVVQLYAREVGQPTFAIHVAEAVALAYHSEAAVLYGWEWANAPDPEDGDEADPF
jgi:hypothetical protein